MKKIIIAVAAIIATNAAFAQQKIGFLNSTEIIQGMSEYKLMSEAIEKKKGEYTKVMEDMYAEYDKKSKELQAGAGVNSPAQDMKAQELKDLEKRMNDFQQKAQGDLSAYAQEISKPLQSKYQSAVKEVAKEQGYTYIMDLAQNTVVYHPETGFDISDPVRAKLKASPPATIPTSSTPKPVTGKK